MPNIRCSKCGKQIVMDDEAFPYKGELACENCKNVMRVNFSNEGFTIETNHPNPQDDFSSLWWTGAISGLEKESITEAALCLGSGAYTASEFMALRTLESVCRRYYKQVKKEDFKGSWASIIDDMAQDPSFQSYTGALNYFREVRNRIGHPEGTSSRLDAESSYKMSVRLAKGLIEKLSSLQKPK